MTVLEKPKIVVLGMMSKLRVAGAVWQTLHYVIGLQRLGYEVYYVEAHGCYLWAFKENEFEAAAFIDSVMRRFGMGDYWAFHSRSGTGQYYGMSEYRVKKVYGEAAGILNLHGGTVPAAEHIETERLIYIDTDPTAVQIEIHEGNRQTLDMLEPHCGFFTFGENYGHPDCKLPVSEHFHFQPTRQPVVLDFWETSAAPASDKITTIGNWQQLRRVVEFEGEEYHWSKHYEFMKVLNLPKMTHQHFELSLSGCDETTRGLLQENGWEVRDAASFSLELNSYRDYICESRGEFTVAKDQNIRFRTGWFSDRSATYLAAGRPVITQETGFSNVFPTGDGLFAFSTLEEILGAVDAINSDYSRHSRWAHEIAREHFSYDVVLPQLLSSVGIVARPSTSSTAVSKREPSERKQLPGPIHVIGHAEVGTGLGATARRYSRALALIGAEIQHGNLAEVSKLMVASHADVINLICCDVASQSAVLSAVGEGVLRRGYNIGLWLWELPAIPREWHDRFAYYDEIWVPTSFLAAAFASISPVPVITIPHVLEADVAGDRTRGRKRLGLSSKEFSFLFIFNFHSRVERKNPLAVINSFKAAFGLADPVRLVIKCINPDFSTAQLAQMTESASDPRITIHAGEWSDAEMADLMASCDCYVSLHRAEGVGLTIGDAMAAGKPVIATGWSGNMEFMTVTNSFPLRYRMVPLESDVAHYRAGDVWAEPSEQHAAEMLRYVFEHPEEAAERGRVAQQDIAAHFSYSAVGKILASRLAVIGQRRQFSEMQRRLREPIADVQSFLDEFGELKEYVPARQLRYQELKRDLRLAVRAHVPPEATVLVVSKGDDELLDLGTRRAWHFPQAPGGEYAGYHPADSADAILKLESLRTQGGDYLLFPHTSLWWLEHYGGFHDYLRRHYSVTHSDSSCLIYGLSQVAENSLQIARDGVS